LRERNFDRGETHRYELINPIHARDCIYLLPVDGCANFTAHGG
jgi:hypothetical protein